jgi:hypothetical protein
MQSTGGKKAIAANDQLRAILGELHSAFESVRPIEPTTILAIDEASERNA